MTEIWKEVEGFPDYFVSSKGRVLSGRTGELKIRKTSITRYGYEQINLGISKRKCKRYTIHRLVAMHFLDNPEELPQVNHIDGNKLNNDVSNLEWVSAKQNTEHAYSIGLKNNDSLVENGMKNARRISQIDTVTLEVLRVWNTSKEPVRELGYDSPAILRCCHLQADTHKGFRWRFTGEEGKQYAQKEGKELAHIVLTDADGNDTVYASAAALANGLGIRRNSVYRAISQGRLLCGKYKVNYQN